MASLVRSRRIPVILNCAALLGSLTLSLSAVPANAAQIVPISVSGDYVLQGNDLTQIPQADPNSTPVYGLVCSGKAPQERYELGFQGVLNMTSVWEKWRDMRGVGSIAAIWKPELHPDKLTLVGEWETSFTVDPQKVDILKDKYTVEAVQARFDEANKDNGSRFTSFMRVQSVSFENGVFTARYKLQTRGADGTYTDGILGAALNGQGATPDTVYLPSLDDSLYVSRDQLDQLAQNQTPIVASKPTVKGQIDVPRLTHIYALGINEMRPIVFEETIGADLTVQTALRPYVVVQHQTNAPSDVAVPNDVTAFDAEVELAINADPNATPLLPSAGQKVDTPTAVWSYTGVTKTEDVCGKRTYIANWTYEKKALAVTTVFESLSEGVVLPQEIRDLIPQDGTVQRNGTAVPAKETFEPLRIESDASAGGKPTIWFFEGWSPASFENVTEDVSFKGRWVRKLEVTPTAPTLQEPSQAGLEKTVEIPTVKGIVYTSQRQGTQITVKAVAEQGYALASNTQREWVFDVAAKKPGQTTGTSDQKTPGTPAPSTKGKMVPSSKTSQLASTGANAPIYLALAGLLAGAGGIVFFRSRR